MENISQIAHAALATIHAAIARRDIDAIIDTLRAHNVPAEYGLGDSVELRNGYGMPMILIVSPLGAQLEFPTTGDVEEWHPINFDVHRAICHGIDPKLFGFKMKA